MVLKNRQSVSITGLRNRQSVSVMGLINRQLSLRNSAKHDDIRVTETDCLFLKPDTETDCLFLRPVMETDFMFFSTLYSNIFSKISQFRGEEGSNQIFEILYSVQDDDIFHI